jgi:hypothetical protein
MNAMTIRNENPARRLESTNLRSVGLEHWVSNAIKCPDEGIVIQFQGHCEHFSKDGEVIAACGTTGLLFGGGRNDVNVHIGS